MPVRSLLDLASLACIKNIRHLDSVGDYLPYDTVRHILLKVENAHQLRRIELNSPQIEGRTGEIWLKIIERDFPLEFRSKAYKPQNPSKWYRVWEKYKGDHDRSVEESEMKLRNAMAGLQEARERNTSKIVERKLLPRKGATGPRRGGHRADTSSSTLNFTGGTRTKTSTGASVMRKVRREANEIASITGSLSRAISLPQRRPAQAVLKKAPQAMIDDRRRAAQPSPAPPRRALAAPRVPSAVKLHEERATFISDSEEEEGNPDGDATGHVDKKRPAAKATARVMTKTAPKVPTSSGLRRAAAASLLKTRPSTAASLRTTAAKAAITSRTAEQRPRPVGTSSSPVKAPSSMVEPGASSPEKHPPKTSRLPDQDGLNPAQLGAGSPPPRPPKRKAPDIFMRPKKRPH